MCMCMYVRVNQTLTSSHCSVAQGYNDNSGLAPALTNFLQDESDHGQILILLLNSMGDNQMESYFAGGGGGGMMCEGDISGAQFDSVFQRIYDRYQASFETIGGKYIKSIHEKHKTCSIRLADTVFFEVRGRSGQVTGLTRTR